MYPNLNAEIARAGLNQTKLAKMIGMKPTTAWNKLTGRTRLYMDEGFAIKDVLEKSLRTEFTVDYLFRRAE